MSYVKQDWTDYNKEATWEENVAAGSVATEERLDHMEDGIEMANLPLHVTITTDAEKGEETTDTIDGSRRVVEVNAPGLSTKEEVDRLTESVDQVGTQLGNVIETIETETEYVVVPGAEDSTVTETTETGKRVTITSSSIPTKESVSNLGNKVSSLEEVIDSISGSTDVTPSTSTKYVVVPGAEDSTGTEYDDEGNKTVTITSKSVASKEEVNNKFTEIDETLSKTATTEALTAVANNVASVENSLADKASIDAVTTIEEKVEAVAEGLSNAASAEALTEVATRVTSVETANAELQQKDTELESAINSVKETVDMTTDYFIKSATEDSTSTEVDNESKTKKVTINTTAISDKDVIDTRFSEMEEAVATIKPFPSDIGVEITPGEANSTTVTEDAETGKTTISVVSDSVASKTDVDELTTLVTELDEKMDKETTYEIVAGEENSSSVTEDAETGNKKVAITTKDFATKKALTVVDNKVDKSLNTSYEVVSGETAGSTVTEDADTGERKVTITTDILATKEDVEVVDGKVDLLQQAVNNIDITEKDIEITIVPGEENGTAETVDETTGKRQLAVTSTSVQAPIRVGTVEYGDTLSLELVPDTENEGMEVLNLTIPEASGTYQVKCETITLKGSANAEGTSWVLGDDGKYTASIEVTGIKPTSVVRVSTVHDTTEEESQAISDCVVVPQHDLTENHIHFDATTEPSVDIRIELIIW